MFRIFFIFFSVITGTTMASEFEARQAFLLIDAEPGETLKFVANDPDTPSFSIESEDEMTLIPVSAGQYQVEGLSIQVEDYKINLVKIRKIEDKWILVKPDQFDAEDYLQQNYPLLKIPTVIRT